MGTLLEGITIIDLSTVVSGPFAVRMLLEQGASVVKVEAPGMGDAARYIGTSRNGVSAMYTTCNHGKEVRTLDVKTEEGRAELLALVDEADLLVQNFRPGAMDRLGLGWDTLHARNPQLIYLSISGFGPSGPMSGVRVYDPIIQAAAGICDTQVDPLGGGPLLYQGILADKITSLYTAQAAFAALLERSQQQLVSGTSEGRHIELNMFDCAIHFNWPEGMYNHTYVDPGGVQSAPDFSAGYRLTPVADGHLAYSVVTDSELSGAMRAVGLDHLFDDPAYATPQARSTRRIELLQTVRERVMEAPSLDDLLTAMWHNDVPASRVESRADLHAHPQVDANSSIRIVDDAIIGEFRQSAPVFEIG